MTIREELYQEINATRDKYDNLVESIPENAYPLPTDNPAWNVGQILYHMSMAPRNLRRDVKMILGQNWLYRLIPSVVPKKLFDWLNKHLTRYGARKVSQEFLAAEYEKAHKATLKALAEVEDKDFEKSLVYPGWDPLLSGEITLESLFHYVKKHFDSHAAQLTMIVKSMHDSTAVKSKES
jgi:hypothetical protein